MNWLRRIRSNPVTLNEQPNAIAALTAAIGPSVGYHISECKHGGFIVIVDGAIHCARSTLPEAIQAMGKVAADRYGKSATDPEHAAVVRPQSDRVEDDPDLDGAADVAGQYGPERRAPNVARGSPFSQAMRRTAQVVLFVLMIGSAAMSRVT
jgi:hypothetical protein